MLIYGCDFDIVLVWVQSCYRGGSVKPVETQNVILGYTNKPDLR